jgi:hypothetical protein
MTDETAARTTVERANFIVVKEWRCRCVGDE